MEQSQLVASNINPETMERVQNIISILPTQNDWRAPLPSYLYQGFWCPALLIKGIILAQKFFKAEPSDVFVCGASKTGNTWIKALTFAIVTRNSFKNSTNPLLSKVPHDILPFYEADFHKSWPNIRQPGIPLLTTHTPYTSLPKSIQDSECKIVYVCRDAKDTFVSHYHFAVSLRSKEQEPLSLEEAFDLFCQGKSFCGPYWEHVLGYWQASMERPDKVIFLKYEDIMKDTIHYVKKMAEFMGYPFSSEEEKEGVVQKIVEMCSFEFLSNLDANKNEMSGSLFTSKVICQNNFFFRKGKVGDWKKHLTLEMAERLDRIMEQKLGASGLTLVGS